MVDDRRSVFYGFHRVSVSTTSLNFSQRREKPPNYPFSAVVMAAVAVVVVVVVVVVYVCSSLPPSLCSPGVMQHPWNLMGPQSCRALRKSFDGKSFFEGSERVSYNDFQRGLCILEREEGRHSQKAPHRWQMGLLVSGGSAFTRKFERLDLAVSQHRPSAE